MVSRQRCCVHLVVLIFVVPGLSEAQWAGALGEGCRRGRAERLSQKLT